MKYVIVGLGNIGRKRKEVLGSRCVATADPNADADYGDYREISLEEFDASILAVPNDLKAEMAEYFMASGKHVLCEKPLMIDEDTMKKLSRLAKENRVSCYTSYNHRFEPNMVELKKLLDGIGEIYFADLTYGNGTVRNLAGSWRDDGAGVVEDLGCHLLDLAEYLFDRSDGYRITGLGSREANAYDWCRFTTEDGMINFQCSFLMWKNTFTVNVYGGEGSLHIDGLDKWGGSRLTRRKRVYPSGVPEEKITETMGPDKTWAADIQYFEQLAVDGMNTLEKDYRIASAINGMLGCVE